MMTEAITVGQTPDAKSVPVLATETERLIELKRRMVYIKGRVHALANHLHGGASEPDEKQSEAVPNGLVEASTDLSQEITKVEDALSRLEG